MEIVVVVMLITAIFGNGLETLAQDSTHKEICSLPLETGLCRAGYQVWGFSDKENACVEFTWGGCDGNENRFQTKQACEDVCGNVKEQLEKNEINDEHNEEFEEVQGVCHCKCPISRDLYRDRKLKINTFFEGKRAFPGLNTLGNAIGNMIFN